MKRRHSFVRFFLPQLLFLSLYVGYWIYISIELLFISKDILLGLSSLGITVCFIGLIVKGLEERAVSYWNKVVVFTHEIQAFSLRGKLLCTVNLNETVYYSVLKLRDEWISTVDVLVVSNYCFELPNDSEIRFRDIYNRQKQILIIDTNIEDLNLSSAIFVKSGDEKRHSL